MSRADRRYPSAPRGRCWWPLLALLTLLAGCGFQLRGAVEIPAGDTPLYVEAPAGSPVAAAIDELLAGSNVAHTRMRSEARLIVRILTERRGSRVASVDVNSKSLASDLSYLVRFDAIAPDGSQRVAPQTIQLIRTFDNPDVEVLGKQLEAAEVYRDFATDAAERMLMRLRAVLI